MSRCILVGGIPYLSKRARHEIKRQLGSILQQSWTKSIANDDDEACDGNHKSDTVDDSDMPFDIKVSITTHQCVDETILILFAKQVNVSTVEAICRQLNDATPHMIRISERRKDASGKDTPTETTTTTTTFEPRFSLGAGAVRDHAFPNMPYALRRQVQCDGVGIYSLTPQRAANRTARLLRSFFKAPDAVNSNTGQGKDDLIVVDGMAGVGGNTLGFLTYDLHVTSLEIDEQRKAMLDANIALWKQWHDNKKPIIETRNQSVLDHLSKFTGRSKRNILFLDPPWGGAQYSKIIQQNGGDILVGPSKDSQPKLGKKEPTHSEAVGWKFSSAVLQVVRANKFRLVAMKLPTVYEVKLIIDPLVHDDTLGYERPHPFRFQFGKSVQLLVVVFNDGTDPLFANGPSGLDRMISSIMTWHNSMGLQEDDGCREHRPEFYDFEKRRWILLKKWKGSKASVNS